MILTGRGADMAQHRGGFKVKVAGSPPRRRSALQKFRLMAWPLTAFSDPRDRQAEPPKRRFHALWSCS